MFRRWCDTCFKRLGKEEPLHEVEFPVHIGETVIINDFPIVQATQNPRLYTDRYGNGTSGRTLAISCCQKCFNKLMNSLVTSIIKLQSISDHRDHEAKSANESNLSTSDHST